MEGRPIETVMRRFETRPRNRASYRKCAWNGLLRVPVGVLLLEVVGLEFRGVVAVIVVLMMLPRVLRSK